MWPATVEEALEDPNHPITQNFLFVMRTLTPADRAASMNPEHWRDEQRQTLEELIAVLPKKTGKALTVSLSTAANEAWNVPDVPKATIDKLTEQLISMFDQLSAQDQNMLLTYRWDKVASPKLAPLLQRVAQRYEDFPQMREMNAYTQLQVTASALRHWYEMDPEGARPAVIAEITRLRPRYGVRLLGMLPDKTLPEADSALAEHLRTTTDLDGSANLASLIARYASDAILPQVLSQLDPHIGKWACAIQNPLLAYVLRVAPELARPRIEQAITTRGPDFTACYNSIFQEISEMHFDPVLEEIGIRSLDDPDAQVAMTAATMLGRFGSSSAEPALLERYRRWSQQWTGRESELNVPFAQSSREVLNQRGLGQNLMMSLATGQHWFADKKKLEQLSQMSKVSSIQDQAEQCVKAWQNQPLTISFSRMSPYGEFRAQVAQYALHSIEALKEKLVQFPSGTKFILSTESNAPSRELKKATEIREFVTSYGMELVDQSRGH
jgi:hypothetical protein